MSLLWRKVGMNGTLHVLKMVYKKIEVYIYIQDSFVSEVILF
jgi:hypothetical protein